MNIAYAIARQRELNATVLCCRYVTMALQSQSAQVRHDGVARDQEMNWAFGFLASGECELLGVWLKPMSSPRTWHGVFGDLKVRGVEQIRFVTSSEPTGLRDAVGAAYPSTAVLPSIAQFLRQSLADVAQRNRESAGILLRTLAAARTAAAARAALSDFAASPWGTKHPATVERWRVALDQLAPIYALPTRLRRIVVAGDDAARQLHQSLSRSVARHGAFADEAAAASFVSEALTRAEHRFGLRTVVDASGNYRARDGGSAGSRPRVEVVGA